MIKIIRIMPQLKLSRLIFALLLFTGYQSSAQGPFQRLFTSEERVVINFGSEPASGGGFYTLNTSFDPNSGNTEVDMLLVTRHDPKGNLLWAEEYVLKGNSFYTNLKTIDFKAIPGDQLLITGSSANVDFGITLLEDERFIFKIDGNSGEVLFADQIRDNEDAVIPVTFPYAIEGFSGGYNYFSSHSSGDSLGIQRVFYDDNDTIISERAYYTIQEDLSPPFNALIDVGTSTDMNYVLSISADLASTRANMTYLEPEGAVISSYEYFVNPDSIPSNVMQTVAITSTPDTGMVQAGIILDALTGQLVNYLIKTDSTGAIEWSKLIDGNSLGLISQVNDVVVTSMDEIMVTAKYVNLGNFSQGDIGFYLDLEGNVLRQWDYTGENSFFITASPQGSVSFPNGEISKLTDDNLLYSTVGLDLDTGAPAPLLIKMNPDGQSYCSDTLDLDLIRDYAFLESQVGMDTSDFATVDTFELQNLDYDNFTVPVLTLLDTFFCPQDPILVELDATTEGASSYVWSTGDTSPTILATDEGEYSVTVTVDEKVCYELCDTSNISRREFPEAMINAQFFGVCEVDSAQLVVSANNPIQSIEWSTAETTNSIIVQEPGLYSVSIVDNCGNAAEAQINFSDALFNGSPEIINIIASGRTCEGVLLTPFIVGNTDGLSYAWSGGSDGETLLVNSNGIYDLTVTNSCGNSSEFSINVQNLDALTVDILDEGACDSLVLTANVPLGGFVGQLSYLWSDGSTDNTLDNIMSAGTYSVTVTDDCTEATDEFIISDTIQFANLFFTGNTINSENRRFGAFLRCPEYFMGENYKLEIYNRFGNKVFEADEISDSWNGTHNGEIAPRDVYMYQWSYDLPDGSTVSGEGHVTLAR